VAKTSLKSFSDLNTAAFTDTLTESKKMSFDEPTNAVENNISTDAGESHVEEHNFAAWRSVYDGLFVSKNAKFKTKVYDSFNDLQETFEGKYTMFVDGYYVYSFCSKIGKKVKFAAMTAPELVSSPIYYYMTSYGNNQKTFNFIHNHIVKNPHIQCFFENINPPYKITDKREFSSFINMKTQKLLPPLMITDMLKLLIDQNEVNAEITDVIVLSSNSAIRPAIKVLIDNDIKVHLGLFTDIAVSSSLINMATSVFTVESYFADINAYV
jgi:hypothetical protein